MKIGGLNKCSMIDYPGCVSAVLFTVGCNMHCPYCHNPSLVSVSDFTGDLIAEAAVLDFLTRRQGLLNGVVITGGEPCLQKGLVSFIKKVRQLNYTIKLDTNGSLPQVLRTVIDEKLVDYIAMDIKTSPNTYTPWLANAMESSVIENSVRLIKSSGLPHEFRTTCASPMINDQTIAKILMMIDGADLWTLQHCRTDTDKTQLLDPLFFDDNTDNKCASGAACSPSDMERWCDSATGKVKQCLIR